MSRTARAIRDDRLRRAVALKDRAAQSGSVVAHRICERLALALADAAGPVVLTLEDIKAWVKAHASPGWIVTGEAAEVLRGKQLSCDVITWATEFEGGEEWLPWLGCHVTEPMPRCHLCGEVDYDHGWLPCPACGFEGTADDAAAARAAMASAAADARAKAYARKGRLRDQARRQARLDKVAARTVHACTDCLGDTAALPGEMCDSCGTVQ